MADYKLSCDLYGHSLDVRGLAVSNDSTIISASRDASAKIWKPNGVNPGYHEAQTLRGHTNFVTCVCICQPTTEFPQGIIITSGNDKVICGFIEGHGDPVFRLEGHTNTVCCLNPGLEPNTFLSSSWDSTARTWDWSKKSTEVTYTGHEAAVWSVIQLSLNIVVTASADKTIKVWSKKTGHCQSTLTGHTDCVRGLALISELEFYSCSNDATVRRWSVSGDCLEIHYGHPNFVYSIQVLPDGNGFVSSGEDNVVLIWRDGKLRQTLTLPAQSVWSVDVLPNYDIVTGSSDGVVRVFSADPSRQADESILTRFSGEVDAVFQASEKEIGGVKINQLSGKEGLFEPGRSDGQLKMIRDGAKVICYSWSAEKNEWVCVGDVLGSAKEQDEATGKTMYEGKAYDYVFSVDIQDGVPPLKLPYNVSEDPWHAAQTFIHKNNLAQVYLEQVANFIVTNSKKSQPVAGPSTTGPSEFFDPFTGGSRYIPSASVAPPADVVGTPGIDPFTGASRYTPQVGLNGSKESKSSFLVAHFPQKSYLRFDQANLKVILEKLQEFNRKTGDGAHQAPESTLEGVVKLADLQGSPDPACVPVLTKLLEWPQDIVFPVLDVARLAVRNAEVNRMLCDGSAGEQFMTTLKSFLSAGVGTNAMLALRVISNMFSHAPGESLALGHRDYLLAVVKDLRPPFTKPLEVAATTVLLNLSVAFLKWNEYSANVNAACGTCAAILPRLADSEARYRVLVSLGTLWSSKSKFLPPVDTDLRLAVAHLAESSEERLTSCAENVLEAMK